MKWFKRWGVKDLLELSGDAMKYVIIEDRLIEALRMKCHDGKMSNFECYVVNINPQYKVKLPEYINDISLHQ